MNSPRFARRALISGAAVLSLATSPARATAQATAPAAATQPSAATSPATQTLRRTTIPSNEAPPPPRTLRAYTHVFVAFTVAWLLLFGYAFSLGRRFRKLEQEVDALRGAS